MMSAVHHQPVSMISPLVAHEGELVVLAGRQYVLPPMTLQIRKADIATRAALEKGYTETGEQELMAGVLLQTLQRNYPELTADELGQATYAELVEAYAVLKEQEARLVAEVGKRLAQRAMAGVMPPDQAGA